MEDKIKILKDIIFNNKKKIIQYKKMNMVNVSKIIDELINDIVLCEEEINKIENGNK